MCEPCAQRRRATGCVERRAIFGFPSSRPVQNSLATRGGRGGEEEEGFFFFFFFFFFFSDSALTGCRGAAAIMAQPPPTLFALPSGGAVAMAVAVVVPGFLLHMRIYWRVCAQA